MSFGPLVHTWYFDQHILERITEDAGVTMKEEI